MLLCRESQRREAPPHVPWPMIIGRFLGWILLLAGLFVLVRDLMARGGGFDLFAWSEPRLSAPVVLGELWYAVHPASLQLLQPAIQRHIDPALWDWVVQPILLCWAWAVFVVLGVLLLMLFRRRGERSRHYLR
jgi:hypothetical protein